MKASNLIYFAVGFGAESSKQELIKIQQSKKYSSAIINFMYCHINELYDLSKKELNQITQNISIYYTNQKN